MGDYSYGRQPPQHQQPQYEPAQPSEEVSKRETSHAQLHSVDAQLTTSGEQKTIRSGSVSSDTSTAVFEKRRTSLAVPQSDPTSLSNREIEQMSTRTRSRSFIESSVGSCRELIDKFKNKDKQEERASLLEIKRELQAAFPEYGESIKRKNLLDFADKNPAIREKLIQLAQERGLHRLADLAKLGGIKDDLQKMHPEYGKKLNRKNMFRLAAKDPELRKDLTQKLKDNNMSPWVQDRGGKTLFYRLCKAGDSKGAAEFMDQAVKRQKTPTEPEKDAIKADFNRLLDVRMENPTELMLSVHRMQKELGSSEYNFMVEICADKILKTPAQFKALSEDEIKGLCLEKMEAAKTDNKKQLADIAKRLAEDKRFEHSGLTASNLHSKICKDAALFDAYIGVCRELKVSPFIPNENGETVLKYGLADPKNAIIFSKCVNLMFNENVVYENAAEEDLKALLKGKTPEEKRMFLHQVWGDAVQEEGREVTEIINKTNGYINVLKRQSKAIVALQEKIETQKRRLEQMGESGNVNVKQMVKLRDSLRMDEVELSKKEAELSKKKAELYELEDVLKAQKSIHKERLATCSEFIDSIVARECEISDEDITFFKVMAKTAVGLEKAYPMYKSELSWENLFKKAGEHKDGQLLADVMSSLKMTKQSIYHTDFYGHSPIYYGIKNTTKNNDYAARNEYIKLALYGTKGPDSAYALSKGELAVEMRELLKEMSPTEKRKFLGDVFRNIDGERNLDGDMVKVLSEASGISGDKIRGMDKEKYAEAMLKASGGFAFEHDEKG